MKAHDLQKIWQQYLILNILRLLDILTYKLNIRKLQMEVLSWTEHALK